MGDEVGRQTLRHCMKVGLWMPLIKKYGIMLTMPPVAYSEIEPCNRVASVNRYTLRFTRSLSFALACYKPFSVRIEKSNRYHQEIYENSFSRSNEWTILDAPGLSFPERQDGPKRLRVTPFLL